MHGESEGLCDLTNSVMKGVDESWERQKAGVEQLDGKTGECSVWEKILTRDQDAVGGMQRAIDPRAAVTRCEFA